jgi:excisionase family DNA binding protein
VTPKLPTPEDSAGEWRLPTFDDLARLDRAALGTLYRDVVTLQADLFVRLTACQHEAIVPGEDAASRGSWLTVKGAAERWRKSPCWVRRAIHRGEVRARKLGGEWRIPASVVVEGT